MLFFLNKFCAKFLLMANPKKFVDVLYDNLSQSKIREFLSELLSRDEILKEFKKTNEERLALILKQAMIKPERLADMLEKRKVNEQMLDELGWTQQDLRRFVERWQQRKAAARNANGQDPLARKKLDDALRHLGLRPKTIGGRAEQKKDAFRDVHEGQSGPVPIKWRDRLKAYREGIARSTEILRGV